MVFFLTTINQEFLIEYQGKLTHVKDAVYKYEDKDEDFENPKIIEKLRLEYQAEPNVWNSTLLVP